MRKSFSNSWQGSNQVRKQRKYRYNAPLHKKSSFLSANLSKDLRVKHKMRSVPLRKGDEVVIMRGSFAKKKAKIINVELVKSRVTLEGITRNKKDGSKTPVFFKAHSLQIVALTDVDKRRFKRGLISNSKEKPNAPNKS